MLMKHVLRQWQRNWTGPAVRLTAAGRDWRFGESEPEAHVIVHRRAPLGRSFQEPSMIFGEGYVNGDIEVRGSLMSLLAAFYQTESKVASSRARRLAGLLPAGCRRIGAALATAHARHHYDIGNEFFALWLDPSMTYSCAYYLREEDDLACAQRQKIELLCRKARLERGQTLLDIGCGWGALILHVAADYGVRATGITPSTQQARYVEAQANRLGLADRVRVITGDWRSLSGRYDRIISVGMFEHVGRRQYTRFLRLWRGLLAPGGLSILHTIGRMAPQRSDPWITRYIFPGGYLPSLAQIASTAGNEALRIIDVENLACHYARTLAHWSERFERVRERVVSMYDEAFTRMWRLYLQGSEAAFRWGSLQLWQIVLDHARSPYPWPLDREVNVAARRGLRVAPRLATREAMMASVSAWAGRSPPAGRG